MYEELQVIATQSTFHWKRRQINWSPEVILFLMPLQLRTLLIFFCKGLRLEKSHPTSLSAWPQKVSVCVSLSIYCHSVKIPLLWSLLSCSSPPCLGVKCGRSTVLPSLLLVDLRSNCFVTPLLSPGFLPNLCGPLCRAAVLMEELGPVAWRLVVSGNCKAQMQQK